MKGNEHSEQQGGREQCIVVWWQWDWGLCAFYLYLSLNIEVNSLILNKEKILGETTRPKVMILVGVGGRVWGRGWDGVVLVTAATS